MTSVGDFLQQHGFGTTQDMGLIKRQSWQGARPGASSQDNMRCPYGCLWRAIGVLYRHHSRSRQASLPPQDLDLVLAHEELHPLGQAVRPPAGYGR